MSPTKSQGKNRKTESMDIDKGGIRSPSQEEKKKRGQSASSASSSSPQQLEVFLLSMFQNMTRDLVSSMNANKASRKKMGKTQLDDVVRGLEELNAKWFRELLSKVKGDLARGDEDDSRSIQSLSSDEVPTPQSGSSTTSSPKSSTPKLYQTTVEDDPEDDYFTRRSHAKDTGFETPSPSTQNNHSSSSSSSSSSAASSPTSTSSSYSYGSAPLHNQSPSSPSTSPPHSTNTSPAAAAAAAAATSIPPKPKPTVRFSDRLQPSLAPIITNAPYRQQDSPKAKDTTSSSGSSSTGPTLSAVDLKWGNLFNEKNEPMPALGRFLRGIANYIIAAYTPTNSQVITPEKLYKFYNKYKLEGEVFPFQRIFDTRYHTTHHYLESLYLDLACEYHLVQGDPASRPYIPALTPAGFENWMTLLIRASPDREARRLNLVVTDLPIVAAAEGSPEDRPERLPAQISRHLFPDRCHARSSDLLTSSFTKWSKIVTPPDLSPRHSTSSSSSSSPSSSFSSSSFPTSSRKLHKDKDKDRDDRSYRDQHIESTPYSRSSSHRTPSHKVYDRGSGGSTTTSRKHPHESRHHDSSRRSRDRSPPVADKYRRSKRYRERSPQAEERRSSREKDYRGYGQSRRSTS